MKKNLFIAFLFCSFYIWSNGQIILPETKISLPVAINETSGIEWMNDSIWVTHNDSGNDPILYFLNKKGELKYKIKLKKAINSDWEDICFDGNENLYISDLGNNLNNRKNLNIHRYSLKDSSEKKYSISYADQKFPMQESNRNFDSEAMIYRDDFLYTFTKTNSTPYNGVCKMYKVNLKDSVQIATPMDSLILGDEGYWKNSVTSADLSNDKTKLVLLTYKYLYLFHEFKEDDFFGGKYMRFLLPEIQQREAVVFDSSENIWITDENSRLQNGGFLYFYNMQKIYSGESFYRNPEIGIVSVKLDKDYTDIYGIENCQFKLKAEITVDGRYTIEILKNGKLFKTYWNDWSVSDKKIELTYYLGETISKENDYAIRIYRGNNLVYQNKIKL